MTLLLDCHFQVVLKEDGKSMIVSDDDIRGNLKVSDT